MNKPQRITTVEVYFFTCGNVTKRLFPVYFRLLFFEQIRLQQFIETDTLIPSFTRMKYCIPQPLTGFPYTLK